MTQSYWSARCFTKHPERENDHRSPYQRDKARILHSAAFRRLQSKTQVLGIGIGDFYRTRLTHSLETSQIGQGIVGQLQIKYPDLTSNLSLDFNLLEALCLAHDIGHPPFGHGGEIALNYMMRNHGGFEGNGQTFRIVTKLEPYTAQHGMDLCRRTILGLIKYPGFIDQIRKAHMPTENHDTRTIQASHWHPPKGLYSDDKEAFEWLLSPLTDNDRQLFQKLKSQPSENKHGKTQFKSFDCSVMELADDIAYGIHDLEDAIVMGIVRQQEFYDKAMSDIKGNGDPWLEANIDSLAEKLFSREHHLRKDAIGALVNHFITYITVAEIEAGFDDPLLKYNAVLPENCESTLQIFKKFVYECVIRKPEIQQLEYKGQQVVMELFTAFNSDPERLLPENTRERWRRGEEIDQGSRVIADYISGMTDEFASRMHANLFLPKNQSIHTGQFY